MAQYAYFFASWEESSMVERMSSENGRSGPRLLHVEEWQVVFSVAGTMQRVSDLYSPVFQELLRLLLGNYLNMTYKY